MYLLFYIFWKENSTGFNSCLESSIKTQKWVSAIERLLKLIEGVCIRVENIWSVTSGQSLKLKKINLRNEIREMCSCTYKNSGDFQYHFVKVSATSSMGFKSLQIARDQWGTLRDLYASDRTNLTGFDLIEYFMNYKPSSNAEAIEIYSTDKDWTTHGSYILVVNAYF